MLSLSQSVGYAIRALTCLVIGDCSTRFVQEIATCSGVPPAYLAKVFKRLAEAGILDAKRGPRGGTRLARPASSITLLQIAEAVDGPTWMEECLLGFGSCCDLDACPSHAFWQEERARIANFLRQMTLADIREQAKQSVCRQLATESTSKPKVSRATKHPPQ